MLTVEDEIQSEQRHADRIYRRLADMVRQARLLAEEGHARARIEDADGLKFDHHRRLFERDALVHHASRRIARLNAEHGGLVFGRLDRRGGEIDYIGRIGVWDEEYEPLLIDWRAPAAATFYRATAVDPMGVVRRRVLHSLGERITGIEDDLLDPAAAPPGMTVIGDGALIGALSRSRGASMRDIVATIQREQDDAIRAPASGATLISGGPGTGKTVVALHRAAYLLYSDRRRFEGGGVLVVGPTPGFMRYIERVLPSLGEESVTLRSMGELLDGTTAVRRDEPEAAAIKGSTRMLPVLTRAVRDRVPGSPRSFRMYFQGRILELAEEQLDAIRERLLARGMPRNAARSRAARGVAGALWRQLNSEEMTAREFAADILDRDEFLEFLDAWWPVLEPSAVLRRLAENTGRYADGNLGADEAAALAASWAGAEPSVEDVALLDELRVLLGDPPPRRDPEADEPVTEELTTVADRLFPQRERVERPDDYDEYAHVLVDEAQDLTPMQWRMLGRRGRNASWTIVGDRAQSAWPDAAEAEAAMDEALGSLPRHRFHLTTNYRNSREIFGFAADLIRSTVPDADLPRAVRSTGHPPDQRVVASPVAAAPAATAELLDAVAGTVAVVVPEHVDLRLEAGERVSVVSALECKGMEYDGVVVVDPARIVAGSPMGRRLLYVALTRATQRLIILATGPAPYARADAAP